MSEILSSTRSFNNRLVLEPYKKEGLKSSISSGFAMIEQKVSLKGLRVLIDTKLADGTFIPRESVAYLREETLHTSQWANKILQVEGIQGEFIIADMTHVEFIAPPLEGSK